MVIDQAFERKLNNGIIDTNLIYVGRWCIRLVYIYI